MEEFTTTWNPNIPDRCKSCPRVELLGKAANKLIAIKDGITNAALSDELPEFGAFISEASDGNLSSDEVVGGVRQSAADMLDRVDERLATLEQRAQMLANTCLTPLTMRAAKGDRQFQVTLCTTTMDQVGEPESDQVRVLRTKQND